jgi:hypothetical protein
MFNNFSKSIFVRILCSVFAALLIGVVCIFTGSYIIEKESLNKLKYLTENQAYKIESSFGIVEKSADNLSYIFSNMAYTKKTKGDSSYSIDYTEQMDNIIKKFSIRHNNIIEIYVYLNPEYSFDKKQNKYFYAKSSLKEAIKKQVVDKKTEFYFKNLYSNNKKIDDYDNVIKIKNDRGIWSDPNTDKFSKLNFISYIKPITLNNKRIGTIIVNALNEDLINSLSNLKIYNKDDIFLIDNCYCFISSNKKNETSKNFVKNNKLLLNLLTEKLKKENNGIINYKQDGVEQVSGFFRLENGFIYVITVPKDEVFEQKYQLQRLISGIIIMGIFSVILIVLNI